MRTLVASSLALFTVVLSVPCQAQTAQAEEPNRVFFFRGGLGVNVGSIRADNPSVDGVTPNPPTSDHFSNGYDIDLELGVSLARHVVIGGVVYLMHTQYEEPGVIHETGNMIIAAVVDGYFMRTGEGPHVLGFAGVGNYVHFGGGAGAGYDFKLSERWSLGPLARFVYADSAYYRTIAATLDVVATFN